MATARLTHSRQPLALQAVRSLAHARMGAIICQAGRMPLRARGRGRRHENAVSALKAPLTPPQVREHEARLGSVRAVHSMTCRSHPAWRGRPHCRA